MWSWTVDELYRLWQAETLHARLVCLSDVSHAIADPQAREAFDDRVQPLADRLYAEKLALLRPLPSVHTLPGWLWRTVLWLASVASKRYRTLEAE